jgi:hypothetical protein
MTFALKIATAVFAKALEGLQKNYMAQTQKLILYVTHWLQKCKDKNCITRGGKLQKFIILQYDPYIFVLICQNNNFQTTVSLFFNSHKICMLGLVCNLKLLASIS